MCFTLARSSLALFLSCTHALSFSPLPSLPRIPPSLFTFFVVPPRWLRRFSSSFVVCYSLFYCPILPLFVRVSACLYLSACDSLTPPPYSPSFPHGTSLLSLHWFSSSSSPRHTLAAASLRKGASLFYLSFPPLLVPGCACLSLSSLSLPLSSTPSLSLSPSLLFAPLLPFLASSLTFHVSRRLLV